MSKKKHGRPVLLAGLMASVAVPNAFSQSAGGEDPGVRRSMLEEVVVSARKRDESVLDVPLSLQAFSSDQMQAAGLNDLESLANFTPNLDFQSMGNVQPGRWSSAVRFRGMDTSITTPTNQTGGFFVDGVNVLGGAASISMADIERVEVIRGPQPVYFGRGTFGGAINYTTITPGHEFSGAIDLSYSPTFGSSDLTAWVEGGLTDSLTARLTYSGRKQGAAFTATDGGKLGEERTDTLSTIFVFEPNDRFKAKARVAYSEDDDGPAAATFVPFRLYGNTPVGTPITVKTDQGMITTAFSKRYHKGNVPKVRVSNNTAHYVMSNGVSTADFFNSWKLEGDTPDLDGFGLRSDFLTASLSFDYELTEALTLSGLFGYNDKATTQLRDSDQYDMPTYLVKSWMELGSESYELRLAWNDGGPLRLLGGISYSEMTQEGDVDGGLNAFDKYYSPVDVLTGIGPSLLDNAEIETWGLFASVEYDVTEWMTIALEARYQDEEIANSSGPTLAQLTPAQITSYDVLLPRVSVTFKPTDDASIYVSYAEGALPGAYNAMLDTYSPADRARFLAENPKVTQQIDEETLEAYEIGYKQGLLNGAAWFSAVAFHQKWENQKSTGLILFIDENGRPQYPTPTIPGESEQTGIELEGGWQVTDNLTLQAAYGYVDSEYGESYRSGVNSIIGFGRTGIAATFDAEGKTLPRSPKHSGYVSATWIDTLNGEWDYYLRGDITAKSKIYIDELNSASLAGYGLVNFRVGVENQNGLKLELYCTNCADKDGWATGRRNSDWGEQPNFFANEGAVVDPIRPRELGIRTSYRF